MIVNIALKTVALFILVVDSAYGFDITFWIKQRGKSN